MTSVASPAVLGAEGSVIVQKYRLESLIAEGGMGTVWRAFNLQLEVPVAIKLLRAGLTGSDLGERLRVEARAAAKLVHPSIVRVFDVGEAESGEPFIVMELLTGESMGTLLERGALTPIMALRLLLPIAEALSLAHSRGVVHRDLKPDNIFISTEGSAVQPKLLDFGIAKVTSAMVTGSPTLTQTGTLLGSPDYMSPEQARGSSDIDERADIWAFCVVLYEALSGRGPFAGETCQDILRQVVNHEPPPLEQIAGVDPQLSALVQWGLAKDRAARPASIFELGRELAGWLQAQGVSEDVTGSSLEAKWLGRCLTPMHPSRAEDILTPYAHHEHATLVSVVHPSPRVSSAPPSAQPLKRRPRWLPAALVATAALMGAVGWLSVRELGLDLEASRANRDRVPVGTLALVSPPPSPSPATVGRSPLASVAAQPLEVTPIAVPPAQLPALAVKVPKYASIRPRPSASRPPVAQTRPVPAPSPALPQALPAREMHAELMNPY